MKTVILNLPKTHYTPSYVVLFNPSLDEINELVKLTEPRKTWVWIFLTGPIEEVADWRNLPIADHLVTPWYLGDISGEAARKNASAIIEHAFKEPTNEELISLIYATLPGRQL